MTRWNFVLPFLVGIGFGCAKGGGGEGAQDAAMATQISNAAAIFSDSIADFQVHVFYEAGADPYTGYIGVTFNQTWDITQQSFHALFQNHVGRFVTVPTAIGQMTQVPDQMRAKWDAASLIALGNRYAPKMLESQEARLTVIFLNGLYNDDQNIMGVHFAGSPFAFVFKDVVISVGGDPITQRYVEQATVVHELSHAVGLVNNGVPMSVPHEDPAHPKHANDSGCVMFWEIETKSKILSYLAAPIASNKTNLFGPAAINDARNFHP